MATKGKMAGESTIFTRQPPEGFDPEKPYADGLLAWKQREYVAREKFVGIETAKVLDTSFFRQLLRDAAPAHTICSRTLAMLRGTQILRDRMKECYLREGVNHRANCQEARCVARARSVCRFSVRIGVRARLMDPPAPNFFLAGGEGVP